jgi:hypothetical protein
MSARDHYAPGHWHQPTADMVLASVLFAVQPVVEADIREWVESHRIPVPAQHNRQAAAEGRHFEFSNFPVLADWTFDFIRNPETDLLFADGTTRTVKNRVGIVLKDSQSGESTNALHAIAWWLHFRGGNVILVTDNRQQARDFARDRLHNVLDHYQELHREKDDASSTALAVRYDRGTLYLGGGQSSSEFVSKPASLAIADEVAKHDFINEMPTLKLLAGRITADDGARLLGFSTPDNALEYARNPITGILEPMPTKETAVHAAFLEGTRERVEVPCPHCGHWQALKFERLRFSHCKESLPGMERALWNKERVLTETWYQCDNPQCTDHHEDGTVRGRITEAAKAAMIRARRFVATNLQYTPGHRTLQAGGMYNIANASRTWGAIAVAFLTACEAGGDAAMKAFRTEYIGEPFERFKLSEDSLLQVRKLRRGYRRLAHDGTPLLKIPLTTDDLKFVGMTVDVQQDCLKWNIWAFAWDGRIFLLDWGRCAELDDLPAVVDTRIFTDTDAGEWEVVLIYIDTQYRKHDIYRFIAEQNQSAAFTGGLPRWEGIAGRDVENTRAARVIPHWVKEYPVLDEHGTATSLMVRIHNINADHYEAQLHIERIAKFGTEYCKRPHLSLPSDTPDDFLAELANAEQYHTKPDRGGIRDLRWRKRRADEPNDRADGARYAIVMADAVEEEESGATVP